MNLISLLTTSRFFYHTLRKNGKPITPTKKTFKNAKYSITSDMYEPSTHYKGTIVFIPGMNKLGNQDPRMVAVYTAAAKAGFRTIAPDFPLLKKHLIDQQSVDEFAMVIEQAAQDRICCPKEKLGIFSVSFSGSFTLKAIQKYNLSRYVSSFCGIGICYDTQSTLSNILDEPNDDHYPKLIVLKNLLKDTHQLTQATEQAMDLAIDDAYEERNYTLTNAFLKTTTKQESDFIHQVIQQTKSKKPLSKNYSNELNTAANIHISPKELEKHTERICLIHSKTDKVIHAYESTYLFEQLKTLHTPTKLAITTLLDHADTQISIKKLNECYRLINTFNYFFDGVIKS